jgi:hypothetical protein
MSKRTEDDLNNLFKWWHYHRGTAIDPIKKAEFLETAFNNMFLIVADIVGDLKNMENANRPDLRFANTDKPAIVLPKGIKMDVPLRGNGK